ncbi:Lsr2 family protein [Streptomyces sp. NRRL S-87]|uniref:histone-like nucleoid-structuring protein Lsr2 n=1 Tax=Streptomyces sp. NRRL S-87 TaxID=1463920 RepID=UPI0006916730|nr:Lsr2 family protein [Streptomyces sp. NRRL S-87]
MAEKVILVDDLDGQSTAGVERVAFAWKGKEYEIDLSAAHVEEYDKLLGPLLAAARPRQAAGRKRAAGRPKADGTDQRIRAWAKKAGREVPRSGPVPQDLRDAYTAHNAAQEAPAAVPAQQVPAAHENPYIGR